MEPCSLHPVSDELAQAYVQDLRLGETPTDRELMAMEAGFARFLSERGPSFASDGLSLTAWEARVDRGISMLLRPPSRLFSQAGMDERISRRLPIRLDYQEGQMGGCYLPARLMAQAEEILDRNLERSVRRLAEANMDAHLLQGLILEAVRTARSANQGLFEAIGVVIADVPESWPAGGAVVTAPSDRAVRSRIDAALKPADEPGRLRRLFGRSSG
ncbi:MAG: hypothetical protein AB7V46_05975 [Thermomicrobiales bacterium]